MWKYIAGESGKAKFSCAVISDVEDKFLGKKQIIPNEKLMLVPLYSEEEAYYLCGVLNSVFVRAIVASYVVKTEISTHILNIVKPPKYDPYNNLHKKIAELSKGAHKLAKCIYAKRKPDYCREVKAEEELTSVEDELDRAVAQLYNIPEDVVNDFKILSRVFAEEEVSEENVEEEIFPSMDFIKTDIVAEQTDFIEFNIFTAGLCDKAEVVLYAPWGSQKLVLGDGRHRVEVKGVAEGFIE